MTSDMKANIRCVDLCKYLAPLPILALRIEKATVECMARIGLRSIGDIINLPRAPLAARFGTDVLLRLDQALGNEVETFQPINPPKPLYVYHQFSEPISDSND